MPQKSPRSAPEAVVRKARTPAAVSAAARVSPRRARIGAPSKSISTVSFISLLELLATWREMALVAPAWVRRRRALDHVVEEERVARMRSRHGRAFRPRLGARTDNESRRRCGENRIG